MSNRITVYPHDSCTIFCNSLINFGVGVVLRTEFDGVKVGDHVYYMAMRMSPVTFYLPLVFSF